MFRTTKKLLTVLLALSVITTGVLLGLAWFHYVLAPEKSVKSTLHPPNPETVVDHQVQLSGTNYEEITGKDGKPVGTFASTYVKYRASDGTYQPIDTSLVAVPNERDEALAKYQHQNTTNVFSSFFSGESSETALARFAVAGGRSVDFSFIKAAAVPGTIKKNSITYSKIYDGVDATYTITPDTLKEEIVIASAAALDQVRQRLVLNNVYYRQESDGTITFHDNTTKNIVFTAPAPVMYEQGNPEKQSTGLSYHLEATEGGVIFSKVPTEEGQAWLAQAKFPVVIDPGFNVLPPTNVTIPQPTQMRQLEVTFQDSSNAEDGWFVQASLNGSTWVNICQPLTGLMGNCFDDNSTPNNTGTYDCSATSKAGTGGICTITHVGLYGTALGNNQIYYYRVGTYGYIGFGTGGVIDNVWDGKATHLAIDGQFFYTVGYGANVPPSSTQNSWKIEKRWVDDGSLCTEAPVTQRCDGTGFGYGDGIDGDGIITVDNTDNINDIMYPSAIAVDANYIYVAGQWWNCTAAAPGGCTPSSAARQWRIEKRRKDTGQLCTAGACAAGDFGTGGVVFSSEFNDGGLKRPYRLLDMAIDSTGIYMVGDWESIAGYLYMEKRALNTGALCNSALTCGGAFDTDGRLWASSTFQYQDVEVSSVNNNLYLAYNNGTSGAVVVRSKISGAIIGVTVPIPDGSLPMAVKIDDATSYFYVGGYNIPPWGDNREQYSRHATTTPYARSPWFSGTESITHVADIALSNNYLFTFGRDSLQHWRFRKFTKNTLVPCNNANPCDGSVFGTDGILVSNSGNARGHIAITPDNNYFLASGTTGGPGSWRVEKRQTSTGALDNINCSTYGCTPPSGWLAPTPAYRYTLALPLNATPVTDSIYYSQMRIRGVTANVPPLTTQSFTYSWGGLSISDGGLHFGYYPYYLLNPSPIVTNTLAGWNTATDNHMSNPPYITLGGYSSAPTPFSPDTAYQLGVYVTNGDGVRTAPSTQITETTRARNQSAAVIGTVTANSVQVQLNTTPPTDATATNPTNTDYAVCNTTSCNYYLTTTGTWTTTPTWCDLKNIASDPAGNTACQWDPTGANVPRSAFVTVTTRTDGSAIGPNTCFDFTTKSRNRDTPPVEGEQTGSCANNYKCSVNADCAPAEGSICDTAGYTPYSAVTRICSAANVPLAPTVVCSYDITNGYWCQIGINGNGNPVNTEYLTERRMCNSAGTACSSWATTYGWSTTITFTQTSLSCSTNSVLYQYRTYARNGNNVVTGVSPIYSDTLPPCVPFAPSASSKTSTSINWTWTAPAAGQMITKYKLTDPNIVPAQNYTVTGNPAPSTYNQAGFGVNPNTSHRLNLQACDSGNANNGNVERCGQLVNGPADVYTYANMPASVTVACNYRAQPDDMYYCNLTIPSDGNPTSPITQYLIEVSYNGGATWELSGVCPVGYTCLLGGWFNKNWASGAGKTFEVKNLICSVAKTDYMFRITTRNAASPQETAGARPLGMDTLPPCQPTNMNHNDNPESLGVFSIVWSWSQVLGGHVVDHYNFYDENNACVAGKNGDGFCTSPFDPEVPTAGPFRYTQLKSYSATKWVNLDPNALYQGYVRAVDVHGRAGRAATIARAYTAIELPTTITPTTITTDQINLTADGMFSRLTVFEAGMQFKETTGHPEGGRENGFFGWPAAWIQAAQVSDRLLSVNTQYCYQVRACNSEAISKNGPGDYQPVPPPDPNYAPAAPFCRYTLANVPTLPIIRRINATDINFTLRNNDGNPKHNGNAVGAETEYAICVTRYNADGTVSEKYLQANGTVNWNGASCASGDGSGVWRTRPDWGNDTGTVITALDASLKYDFKAKARNGDQVETAFGREATLFLVKNNVVGWAWSSNIGWISLNCLNLFNTTGTYSCHTADHWGVNTSFEEGREINPLEGYAWNASGQAIGVKALCKGGADDGKRCAAYGDCAAPGVCEGLHDAKTYDLSALVTQKLLDFEYDTKTAGGPYLWALDSEWPNVAGNDYLRKIDISTDPVTQIGNTPLADDLLNDLEFDKNGNIWVASFNLNKVYVVKPSDLSILTTINITGCKTSGGVDYACNPTYIVNSYSGSNNGDMFVINQEMGDALGSVSRIRLSDYKELNCNGTDPGAGVAAKCIVGKQPLLGYYDVPSDLLLVSNEDDGTISRILVNNPSSIVVQTASLPLSWFYAWGNFARSGANLYVALSPGSGHLGYCSNNNIISCTDNTPCSPGGGYCRNYGEFGNAGYVNVIIGAAPNKNISFGSTVTELNNYFFPKGFSYDGEFLWMVDRWPLGTCKNAPTINCGYWGDRDCGGTLGDCQNPKRARAIQINESTGQVVRDYIIAPDASEGNQVKFADDSIWIAAEGGFVTKIPTKLKEEAVPAGLGWMSFNASACANNSQKACFSAADCNGNSCLGSAGTPPNNILYGYCYQNNTVAAERYGYCSNDSSKLCRETDVTLCSADAHCIYYACQTGVACPDKYNPDVEQCRARATATFNGTTRQVNGYMRLLSMKQRGEALGFPDWGWINLQGTYNDGKGNTGPYGITGTEVDSQQFLGDPDVNPNDIKLYSLFGWGWNAEVSDFSNKSKWLTASNVSQTKEAMSHPMALDSEGNAHIAWTDVDGYHCDNNLTKSCTADTDCPGSFCNSSVDVNYLRWDPKSDQWVDYDYAQDGIARNHMQVPNVRIESAGVNCTAAHNVSLALDSKNNPHLSWTEDSCTNGNYVGIYYQYWDGTSWQQRANRACSGEKPLCVDGASQLKLDQNDLPHLVWYNNLGIYYRYWDPAKDSGNGAWVTASGDLGNTNVQIPGTTPYSAGGHDFSSIRPSLALSNDTIQQPHVAWYQVDAFSGEGNGNVYYRLWNGSNWVTASGDVGNTNIDVSQIAFSDGCGRNPSLGLDYYNKAQIAFTGCIETVNEYFIFFRHWNGSAWATVSGDTASGLNGANLLVDTVSKASSEEAPPLALDAYAVPHVAWTDKYGQEIFYRYWNSTNWVTASGNTNTTGLNVSNTTGDSQLPSLALDTLGNPHIAWWERQINASSNCGSWGSERDAVCLGTDYPFCQRDWAAPMRCNRADIMYTKFTPGIVQSGLGWFEYMPVGALIGIPWVQTMYSDIYSEQSLRLAPPPRGSGTYTSTYLILANGDIQGVPGYYAETQTGPPTSAFQPTGLSPLIGGSCSNTDYHVQSTCEAAGATWTAGASLPLGRGAVSKIDVNALITTTGGKNKYGHTVVPLTQSDLSNVAALGTSPTLNGKIYYRNGSATIDNDMTFMKGIATSNTSGNGLIVIDGDLEINADVYYEKHCSNNLTGPVCRTNNECGSGNTCGYPKLDSLSELPSAGIIVRGNVYINSLVHDVAGVVVAVDNPTTTTVTEGTISTGRRKTITKPIAASQDDTSVDSSYANNAALMSLQFGKNGATTNRSFFRWQMTGIPGGSEIKRAYLRLRGNGNGSGDFKARVYLIKQDDAKQAVLNFTNNPNQTLYDVDTSNSVSYDISNTTWNTGDWNQSPDLKTLVQKFVNSPNYDPASYLGLVIKEGDATAGEYRDFRSYDNVTNGLGANAPQLVIEYAPLRSTYTITDTADDVIAWGTNPGDWNAAQACMNFGWSSALPNRIFFRFSPPTSSITNKPLPEGAQINKAQVRIATNACVNADAVTFQSRLGLLDSADQPLFTANPYNATISQDASEIAEVIPTGQWQNGGNPYIYTFTDISKLIEAWVQYDKYQAGNHIGLRLRRGTNETQVDVGQSRPIANQSAELRIDYYVPLNVSGLFVAQGYNFDRKYTKNLAASEQIVYDGRVVANTPPGLTDFTRALPIFQRVVP